MRIAALIVGILGGVGGFIAALSVFLARGVVVAFTGGEIGEEIALLAIVAFVASVVGLVGGAIAIARPKTAAVLMLVAAIAGVISISAAFIPATILLLIAALLVFLGRNAEKAVT